jgi:hypothetical protein
VILPWFGRHPGLDAQEGRTDLRHQLFGGIGRRAKAALQVAFQAALVPAPVGQLMQRRGVVALAAAELLRNCSGDGSWIRSSEGL